MDSEHLFRERTTSEPYHGRKKDGFPYKKKFLNEVLACLSLLEHTFSRDRAHLGRSESIPSCVLLQKPYKQSVVYYLYHSHRNGTMKTNEDSRQDDLLATKIYLPPTPPHGVIRERLFAMLDEGVKHKLTLISAPPGFGKTALLSTWARASLAGLMGLA